MGLLTSILNLAVVVGAGWFVIYYLIPKLESGGFEALGLPSSLTDKGGSEGSGGEEDLVANDLADAITGDELGTTDAIPTTDEPVVEEKKGKKKKAPYDPAKGIAGKGESKKKKAKTKAEYRIIEFLGGSYSYGFP